MPDAAETVPVALCVCRDSEAAEGGAAAAHSPAVGQGRGSGQGHRGEAWPSSGVRHLSP